MRKPKKMKILFIGCGSIGKRHIKNLRQLYKDQVEIIAYRTFLKVKHPVENFYRDYDVKCFKSLKKALEEKPRVTFITNPTSLHIPMAIKAAEAKSHLFIEKPLSNNLKGVDKLIGIVEKNKLVAEVGFQLRFSPLISSVRKLIQTGKIGRVISVRAEVGQYLPAWHPKEDYKVNYSALKELGGGVILDLIHEIDYVRDLLHRDQINEVFCYSGKYSDLKIETEDIAEILMKSKEGVIISIHMDYLQKPAYRKGKVIGTKGSIDFDLLLNTWTVHNREGVSHEYYFPHFYDKNYPYIEEVDHFIYRVQKRLFGWITLREEKETLKIALAAKKSAQTKNVVRLHK